MVTQCVKGESNACYLVLGGSLSLRPCSMTLLSDMPMCLCMSFPVIPYPAR